jgi:hypothetical protein
VIYYLLLLIQSTQHYSKRRSIVDMSGTDRKRSSKWDLSDEHKFPSGSKQMRSGWSSADVAGNNSSKWAYSEGNDKLRPVMGYSSKESFSGGRGSYEDDAMNEDHRISDRRREWDTDGSYSKKISPWQGEWGQKRHSQSPINGWSRSVWFYFLNIDTDRSFIYFSYFTYGLLWEHDCRHTLLCVIF